jgi:hypothetical protein
MRYNQPKKKKEDENKYENEVNFLPYFFDQEREREAKKENWKKIGIYRNTKMWENIALRKPRSIFSSQYF